MCKLEVVVLDLNVVGSFLIKDSIFVVLKLGLLFMKVGKLLILKCLFKEVFVVKIVVKFLL